MSNIKSLKQTDSVTTMLKSDSRKGEGKKGKGKKGKGTKTRSVIAGKRVKSQIKFLRKMNYKKKVQKQIECSVCYESIPDEHDNIITCGKTVHPLCRGCKLKMKNDDCPMCRSHKIPAPKSQSVQIRVMKQLTGPLNRINVKVSCPLIGKWINGIYEEVDKSCISNDAIKVMDGRVLFCEKKSLFLYQAEDGIWEINSDHTPSTESEEDIILCACNDDIIGRTYWYMMCDGIVHIYDMTVSFIK